MKFEGQKFICLDFKEGDERDELLVTSYLESGWFPWELCAVGGAQKLWLTFLGELVAPVIFEKHPTAGFLWKLNSDEFLEGTNLYPFG